MQWRKGDDPITRRDAFDYVAALRVGAAAAAGCAACFGVVRHGCTSYCLVLPGWRRVDRWPVMLPAAELLGPTLQLTLAASASLPCPPSRSSLRRRTTRGSGPPTRPRPWTASSSTCRWGVRQCRACSCSSLQEATTSRSRRCGHACALSCRKRDAKFSRRLSGMWLFSLTLLPYLPPPPCSAALDQHGDGQPAGLWAL